MRHELQYFRVAKSKHFGTGAEIYFFSLSTDVCNDSPFMGGDSKTFIIRQYWESLKKNSQKTPPDNE